MQIRRAAVEGVGQVSTAHSWLPADAWVADVAEKTMEHTPEAYLNPFTSPGRWYRGNLHTHTTVSDGLLSPVDAANWYRDHGYDFIALTDHDTRTETEGLGSPGFLVVPGIETHPGRNELGESYHAVAVGVSHAHSFTGEDDVQVAIDQLTEDGGIVWLGHPYWAGLTLPEMLGIRGIAGLEVFNATCARFGKGLSVVHWDDLLARRRRLWGLATDDTHWCEGDCGRGWIMLKAPELTEPAILAALRETRFYASQGPEIYDLQMAAQEIYIHCSPATMVTCISLAGWGSQVVAPDPAAPLTEVTFPLRHQRVYVRLEVTDGQGRTAWAQPIWLEG